MPIKRRIAKSKRPEMSNTLLVFVSRGLRGDPATVNPFEYLDYEFPTESMAEQIRTLRDEFFRELSPVEQAEFVRREVESESHKEGQIDAE
jgi:hypothetical protein